MLLLWLGLFFDVELLIEVGGYYLWLLNMIDFKFWVFFRSESCVFLILWELLWLVDDLIKLGFCWCLCWYVKDCKEGCSLFFFLFKVWID